MFQLKLTEVRLDIRLVYHRSRKLLAMSVISRIPTKCPIKVLCQHTFKYTRQFSVSQKLALFKCRQRTNQPQMDISNKDVVELLLRNAHPPLSLCRAVKSHTSSKKEDSLKLKDSIPSRYELVYKAPMDTYMAVSQGISSVSLVAFLAFGISNVLSGNSFLFSSSMELGEDIFIQSSEQMVILTVAFMLANVGVQYVASSYPLRIYHYDHTYISVFTGLLPLQIRTREFKSGDIKQATSTGIAMPWRDAKYVMGGKSVFLLEDYFRRPADFTAMLNVKL